MLTQSINSYYSVEVHDSKPKDLRISRKAQKHILLSKSRERKVNIILILFTVIVYATASYFLYKYRNYNFALYMILLSLFSLTLFITIFLLYRQNTYSSLLADIHDFGNRKYDKIYDRLSEQQRKFIEDFKKNINSCKYLVFKKNGKSIFTICNFKQDS